MTATRETIEVTAGEVAAELKRRGIGSDEKVTLTIEPEQEIIPGRRASRARVVAAGLTDDDIDRLIKQAQKGSRAAAWMRVVVDTNVFVSAALKDKSFPALALHVVAQRGTFLKSHSDRRPAVRGACAAAAGSADRSGRGRLDARADGARPKR